MSLSAWKREILKRERGRGRNVSGRRRFNNAKRQAMLSGGQSWFNVKFNDITITVNFEPSDTPEKVKSGVRDKFSEKNVLLGEDFDLVHADTRERLTQSTLHKWKELNLRVVESSTAWAASASSVGGESKQSSPGRGKQSPSPPASPYEYAIDFNSRIREYEERIGKLRRHRQHRKELQGKLQTLRRAVRGLSEYEKGFARERRNPVFMVGNWSDAAIARWCTGSKNTRNNLRSPDPDWDWLRRHHLNKIRYRSRALFARFCASQALPSVRDQGHKNMISYLKQKLQAKDRAKMDNQIKNFEIPNMGNSQIQESVIDRLHRHNNRNRLKKEELNKAHAVLISCHDGIVFGEDHMDDAILSAKRHLETFHQLAEDIVKYADTQSLEKEEGPKQKMLGALLYLGYYGKALEERLKQLKRIWGKSKQARLKIDETLRSIRREFEAVEEQTRQQDSARDKRLGEMMFRPQKEEEGWQQVQDGTSASFAALGAAALAAASGAALPPLPALSRTSSHDSTGGEPKEDVDVAEQFARLSVEDDESSNKIDAGKCRGCNKNPSGDDPHCRNCTDILKQLGVPPNEKDEHYVRGIMNIFSLSKASKGKKKSGKKKKSSQREKSGKRKVVCKVNWSRQYPDYSDFADWAARGMSSEEALHFALKSARRGDKVWTYVVGDLPVERGDLIICLDDLRRLKLADTDGQFKARDRTTWYSAYMYYAARLYNKNIEAAVAAVHVGIHAEISAEAQAVWFERAWILSRETPPGSFYVEILNRIITAGFTSHSEEFKWRFRLFNLPVVDLDNARKLASIAAFLGETENDNKFRFVRLQMIHYIEKYSPPVPTKFIILYFKKLDTFLSFDFDTESPERVEMLKQQYDSTIRKLRNNPIVIAEHIQLYTIKWRIKTTEISDTLLGTFEKEITQIIKASAKVDHTNHDDIRAVVRAADSTIGDLYFKRYKDLLFSIKIRYGFFKGFQLKDHAELLRPLLETAREKYADAKDNDGNYKCAAELEKLR